MGVSLKIARILDQHFNRHQGIQVSPYEPILSSAKSKDGFEPRENLLIYSLTILIIPRFH